MTRADLLDVSKPARYLGGEINSIKKDLKTVCLKFALAFPDVYEIGMSHLGFQILYHILNRDPQIACERVFVPWPDMEQVLQKKNRPLCSLESSLPLREFDVLGFSLQYEMNYTGILTILHLSRIPFRSQERTGEDPLILGGGPCAMNPEPVADFFDALVLGDGEEVVLEICREILSSRANQETKTQLLERLAKLQGVYVPSFFQVSYKSNGEIQKIVPLKPGSCTIERRILPDLNRTGLPSQPIVPYMEIIHDRLNIEVARGCTRGCRFCQAGMIYRPLRERSPQAILQWLKEGLKSTGHDEVSLLSLSTGDYSCIEPLLAVILDRVRKDRVAVALPSLRVETLTPSLIQHIQEVRKTGFTLAPEAGTDRLRRVINKGNSEEDLLATLRAIFAAHWRLVKLYFMIGLPTETQEDLEGLLSLCRKARKVARTAKASAQLNVSVSAFIPKAHTPFQWERQSPPEEIRTKHQFLRKGLEKQGVHLKWSDPHMSLLEGIFARGDRRLSHVIESAFRGGCRLDGWGEHFRYSAWIRAFQECGMDPLFYAVRERHLDEILPWDHLQSRVEKNFLIAEREKAFHEIATMDCRKSACNRCGVCQEATRTSNRLADWSDDLYERPLSSRERRPVLPLRRFRAQFTKTGPAILLGHLELSRLILRAFRRAEFPLVFSQGFHPMPRISFGPALPVGYESQAEYLDFFIQGNFSPNQMIPRLNEVLPPGVQILETKEISLKSPSISDNISNIKYLIQIPEIRPGYKESLEQFLQADYYEVFWEKKNRSIDLKSYIESVSTTDGQTFRVVVPTRKDANLRPEEALAYVLGYREADRPPMETQKVEVWFKENQ